MARALLLDVDTGIDDAMAIALATRLDHHELVAITTVAGNVPVDLATRNTQRVVGWLDSDVPVYRGMSAPLVRPLHTAREHHGHDGLGGWQVPATEAPLSDITAPEAIVRLAREHRGDITFAFVGPLTNLAVALRLEPRIVEWVDRLVIMGGAFFGPGNVTPYAEFNIFVDPEAAAQVAAAGFNACWVPLDATHQTALRPEQWQRLASATEPAAVLVREVTRRTLGDVQRPQAYLHDPLAVAVADDPALVETVTGTVLIDVDEHRRGRTRVGAGASEDASSTVARTVDVPGFERLFGRIAGVAIASAS